MSRLADEWVVLALGATALLVLSMSIGVVVLRLVRRRRVRVRAAVLAPVRRILLTAAAGDELTEAQREQLMTLPAPTWAVVESDVVGLLGKVRGDGRDALVGLLDQRGSVDRALHQLTFRRSHRRAAAAQLLGLARPAGGAAALLPLLTDRHAYVRLTAARALGRLADPVAAAPLLATLGVPGATSTVVVSQALLSIGAPAQEDLVRALQQPDDLSRAVAVEVLGLLGAVGASARIGALVAADPSAPVRGRAARALGRIGMPSSSPILQAAALDDTSAPVRLAAVQALADVGDRQSVALLADVLRHGAPAVAAAAGEALVRLAPEGLLALAVVAAEDLPSAGPAIATATLATARLRGVGVPDEVAA